MTNAVADFKLSITKALADQLKAALGQLTPAPLSADGLAVLAPRPGVYELYLGVDRVYVGKAKSSLRDRLFQHLHKLEGRMYIDIADMSFKCLYVDEDLDSASPERMLINAYSAERTNPWNNNGFGNKDPGRNRDHTEVKEAHFDAEHPINLDLAITVVEHDIELSLEKLIDRVKGALPYNLRRDSKTHVAELRAANAVLPGGARSPRELISLIVGALPIGWQATALPGYVILYKEEVAYASASWIWRRGTNGRVDLMVGQGAFAPGEVREDEDDDE